MAFLPLSSSSSDELRCLIVPTLEGIACLCVFVDLEHQKKIIVTLFPQTNAVQGD